jgi:hypothetical protein
MFEIVPSKEWTLQHPGRNPKDCTMADSVVVTTLNGDTEEVCHPYNAEALVNAMNDIASTVVFQQDVIRQISNLSRGDMGWIPKKSNGREFGATSK